jgi:hypothetical protein
MTGYKMFYLAKKKKKKIYEVVQVHRASTLTSQPCHPLPHPPTHTPSPPAGCHAVNILFAKYRRLTCPRSTLGVYHEMCISCAYRRLSRLSLPYRVKRSQVVQDIAWRSIAYRQISK